MLCFMWEFVYLKEFLEEAVPPHMADPDCPTPHGPRVSDTRVYSTPDPEEVPRVHMADTAVWQGCYAIISTPRTVSWFVPQTKMRRAEIAWWGHRLRRFCA